MTQSMIVTGAGTGIGEAIARKASESGYRVGVLDMDGAAAAAVADSLPDAVPLEAAVSDPVAVEAALDQFGTPDAVVNNAGIVRFGPLLDLNLDDWRSVVEVNLTGTFVCATACARRMADNGGGSMVNITSINGIAPGTNAGAYGATKAGINMVTQQMSIEWGPLGIRVNSVAPGLIDGGMSAPIFADPEFRRRRTEKVPAGRLGLVDDIAKAVVFLCSSDADYITGHQLVVDGGVINSIIANLPRPEAVDGVGAQD
ncbi:MAG: SDR family NAD(P)-dependent oxidoreductase [Acidimicrobiales bacterium]